MILDLVRSSFTCVLTVANIVLVQFGQSSRTRLRSSQAVILSKNESHVVNLFQMISLLLTPRTSKSLLDPIWAENPRTCEQLRSSVLWLILAPCKIIYDHIVCLFDFFMDMFNDLPFSVPAEYACFRPTDYVSSILLRCSFDCYCIKCLQNTCCVAIYKVACGWFSRVWALVVHGGNARYRVLAAKCDRLQLGNHGRTRKRYGWDSLLLYSGNLINREQLRPHVRLWPLQLLYAKN